MAGVPSTDDATPRTSVARAKTLLRRARCGRDSRASLPRDAATRARPVRLMRWREQQPVVDRSNRDARAARTCVSKQFASIGRSPVNVVSRKPRVQTENGLSTGEFDRYQADRHLLPRGILRPQENRRRDPPPPHSSRPSPRHHGDDAAMFGVQQQHAPGHVLCCMCGMGIPPNPAGMCVDCIRSQVRAHDAVAATANLAETGRRLARARPTRPSRAPPR